MFRDREEPRPSMWYYWRAGRHSVVIDVILKTQDSGFRASSEDLDQRLGITYAL